MRVFLLANVNALIFLVGFGVFIAGMSAYSGALAAVVAGALLMLMGTWPYLRRGKG